MRDRLSLCALTLLAAAFALPVPPARADIIDPVSGINFVRITHPGNAPWMGTNPPTPGDDAVGRGRVDYEYSIGRFEVGTRDFVPFFNACFDRPAGEPGLPWVIPPTFWGAQGTTPVNNTNPDARRWSVPAGNEMRPVGNISWRAAAMYCNFLHNGGAAAAGPDGVVPRENFLSGAYEVSTFGSNGMGGFADQATRSPGARYFIPSRDEWIKAAHYDPDRYGQDQGGYWLYSNMTDEWVPGGPVGANVHLGPPGPGPDPNGPLAQANYGWDTFTFPGYGSPFNVPLGSYEGVESPWGLMDLSGATSEWTEEIRTFSFGEMFRTVEGSAWNGAPGYGTSDVIWVRGGDWTPNIAAYDFGLRIASVVPAPSSLMGILGCVVLVTQRRRRG